MLSNYAKLAWRQLLKNKMFSAINILGLSVGVACCTLLALYIQDEFSYEQHVSGHERIFRIYTSFTKDGHTEVFPRSSPPIAMDLAEVLPEIELATRMVSPLDVQQHLVRYKENLFYEKDGVLVDSTFFEVFPFEFAEGDPHTALDGPASVVLSAKLAHKIFRDKSPLDELLIINSGRTVDTFRVTGVLRESPYRTHIVADFYACMNSDGWGKYVQTQTTWAWNNFVSGYIKLKPGTSAVVVEEKMGKLLEEKAGADLKGAGLMKTIHLQPLDNIRLYSEFNDSYGSGETGSITYIYILGSIGVFILLIACINFMNLTTAKAAQRAGEVGIRKSMGAHRANLIRQFLGESFVIVTVAMILSILFTFLTIPLVNQMTEKNLSINGTNVFFLVLAVLGIGFVTGIVAGSYPAFFLSAFQPARVLKSKNLTGDGSHWLRQGLVIFQFVITITLISSILIIQQQLGFVRDQPLGFSDDKQVLIPLRAREASKQFVTLRNEFRKIQGVSAVSATSSPPSTQVSQDFALYTEGSTPDKGVLHRVVYTDEDYFNVMDIKLLAGRNFIAESDTFSFVFPKNRVIVNESSLKVFNISMEKALGTRIFTDWEGKHRSHEIVGVVRDYHQFSLHQPIVPMMFLLPADRGRYSFITATIGAGSHQETIAALKAAWDKQVPTIPFEYQYLSESVEKQYESDNKISQMITGSTLLAILISCLGLYGLSVYVAERRLKEIGIRKVLGASVSGIVRMLSIDFIKLVMVAFVAAVPLGYFIMNKWLEGFAYKIELGIGVFVLAGVVSFLIAWSTVGFESFRAALGNPVNALRSE